MSAELMRRAAEQERTEWGDATSQRVYPKAAAIHLALADLLDIEADRFDSTTMCDAPGQTCNNCLVPHWAFVPAANIARAILGEQS